jgi:hypothetical protein
MRTLILILMLSATCAIHAADLEPDPGPMVPAIGVASDPSPLPALDIIEKLEVQPDPVPTASPAASIAIDTIAAPGLLVDIPPEETDRSQFPNMTAAVQKPSAAGPVLMVAGLAMGVVGIIMVSGSEHEVQRTRTVDPCWGRLDFWNVCDEPTRTETYTETNTDWGRQLLGSAAIVGGIGMVLGGGITIVSRHPHNQDPRIASTGFLGQEFAIGWSKRF